MLRSLFARTLELIVLLIDLLIICVKVLYIYCYIHQVEGGEERNCTNCILERGGVI